MHHDKVNLHMILCHVISSDLQKTRETQGAAFKPAQVSLPDIHFHHLPQRLKCIELLTNRKTQPTGLIMSRTCTQEVINEPRARTLTHIHRLSLTQTHIMFLGGNLKKFGYISVTLLQSVTAEMVPQEGNASGRKEAALMNPQSPATFLKVCELSR